MTVGIEKLVEKKTKKAYQKLLVEKRKTKKKACKKKVKLNVYKEKKGAIFLCTCKFSELVAPLTVTSSELK